MPAYRLVVGNRERVDRVCVGDEGGGGGRRLTPTSKIYNEMEKKYKGKERARI